MSLKTQKFQRTLGALALSDGAGEATLNTQSFAQQTNAGPVATYTATTPSFTPRGEGASDIGATWTCTCSTAGDTVTAILKVGTLAVAQQRVVSDGTHGIAAGSFDIPPLAINASAAISLVLSASAGNVSVMGTNSGANAPEVYVAVTEIPGA